jgi:hypothetical protein
MQEAEAVVEITNFLCAKGIEREILGFIAPY